jgi:hypothetical protein
MARDETARKRPDGVKNWSQEGESTIPKTIEYWHLQAVRCESLTRHHRRESCDAQARPTAYFRW